MVGGRIRSGLELIERALEGVLSPRPRPWPSKDEETYLAELRDSVLRLQADRPDASKGSDPAWTGSANRFADLALRDDPRRFLRWDVVVQTMFAERAPYAATELGYLKHRPDWMERWREAIQETWVGNPRRYLYHLSSSRNLIHHAYHVACFEEATGQRAQETDFVLEFGGGYGSMCRLFHRLGFAGTYVIFDLPAFTALQRYYLRTAGLPARSARGALEDDSGVVCISDVRELEALLQKIDGKTRTTFLATWSLSESPREIRNLFIPLVTGFSSFLIAYQERFGGMDNLVAFEEFRSRLGDVAWQDLSIQHIPGSHYLFGRRSNATERQAPDALAVRRLGHQ